MSSERREAATVTLQQGEVYRQRAGGRKRPGLLEDKEKDESHGQQWCWRGERHLRARCGARLGVGR